MATVESTDKDGKTYYNLKYLGSGGNKPTAMDGNEAAKRYQALTQSQGQAAQPSFSTPQQQQPAAQAPAQPQQQHQAANPFGGFTS